LDYVGRAIRPLGFSPLLVIRKMRDNETLRDAVLLSTFPAEWLESYLTEELWRDDPVVARVIRYGCLQRWQSDPIGNLADPKAAAVIERGARYGLVDGIMVPIFGAYGYAGIVSFSSAITQPDDSPLFLALQTLATTIFQRMTALNGLGSAVTEVGDVSLTARERDCLFWASKGKTDSEIAQILSISESTVHFHIENAKRKFGSQSRIQVIVQTLERGIISA
jgi:DNA-binding CsgD family transcriptional regulator